MLQTTLTLTKRQQASLCLCSASALLALAEEQLQHLLVETRVKQHLASEELVPAVKDL